MNAKQEMQNICEAFSEADPEHRADYQANYEKWAKQLDELDKTYQTTLENLSERNIVVAHEAYGYLCRRYNLTQVSIEGMSPDSEPDPGRMADIIDFVRANNVRAIFFEELSGSRTAETVAAETGVKLFDPQPAGRPKRQTGRNRRRLFFRHGRKSAAADRSFAVRSRHMNAIEIKNLHFSYGKENVLDGVSLCLKEGRLAILAGENGAGKSTLLRLLLGELPIGESHKGDQEEGSSDGSIEILGQDIRQFKDWSSISYVPQNGMGGWKDFPASVEEIVRANLYKQIGLFRFAGKKERQQVRRLRWRRWAWRNTRTV